MKKFLNSLFAVMAFTLAPSFAADINDINADFWAAKEINQMVDSNVMTLDANGNFNPTASVERAEFTSMLIKVLNQDKLEVYISNPFSDVTTETKNYDDIMRSEQIGLVYGYPDGTFKPELEVKKSEVTSAVSHITKDTVYDMDALENFVDADTIPAWAKEAYAKTVKYNLYVNYPDGAKFEPNRDMTRAETAVLLAKLSDAISNVREEYTAQEVEKSLSVEHLSINSHAESNLVTITNKRKIAAKGNILKVSFVDKYKGAGANIGDEVLFTSAKDVVTDEGTLVIPAGTEFHAVVSDVVKPRLFNRAGAVKFTFDRLQTPQGQLSEMDATVYNRQSGYLKGSTKGKIGKYTLGGLVLGAAGGTAIGLPTDELGQGLGIGIPCGAAAGFVASFLTKGSSYNANQGDELYVFLNDDLSIYNSDL